MYDIYQCNDDDSARFTLGKRGRRMLFVIGLNPSTANQVESDTTASKVETVAGNNGYDGFVMANLYPLRSTNPGGLPMIADGALIRANTNRIMALTKATREPVFWAAWGARITSRQYLRASLTCLLSGVNRGAGQWVHFGTLCKGGHPRHPSRLSYAWRFSAFDIDDYVQNLTGSTPSP